MGQITTAEAIIKIRQCELKGKGNLVGRRKAQIAEVIRMVEGGLKMQAAREVESYAFHCVNNAHDRRALRTIELAVYDWAQL